MTFNSYQRENSTQQNYLFNSGSELESGLDLGWYQTLFRTYDPALGRFMQIDPLANFFFGINPYSFAFDNPVLNSDPDGLAPMWWLKFRANVKQAVYNMTGRGNQHAIIHGRNRRRGVEVGARTADRRMHKPTSSPSNDTPDPIGNAPSFDLTIRKPKIEFDIPEPRIPDWAPDPKPDPDPIYKGRSIPANRSISFSENISFAVNSDKLYDSPQNDKIINDLIKTLKEYPQLQLFIVGNAGTDKPGQVKHYGNSKEALNQGGWVKGVYTTFGQLMTSRARAVYQALINAGIDAGRLNYGPGVLYPNPNGRKTSFVLKN